MNKPEYNQETEEEKKVPWQVKKTLSFTLLIFYKTIWLAYPWCFLVHSKVRGKQLRTKPSKAKGKQVKLYFMFGISSQTDTSLKKLPIKIVYNMDTKDKELELKS